ncbi:MAG: rhodanese-like domain-containing protein [Desulfopila sp.]
MKKKGSPWQQAALQIPLLLFLSFLLALAINHWREPPLPLVGEYSVTTRFSQPDGENLIVSFTEATQLYEQQAATFLDARSSAEYRQGHIAGALSLPWQNVENDFVNIVGQLEDGGTIITYCDGESCELSHDLAAFLKEMGFADVRVLVNGWSIWQDGGLPTTTPGEADV